MARARKEAAKALSRRVAFRITEDDYGVYLDKVSTSGMQASEFFRHAVIKNQTQIVARAPSSGDRMRALFLINKASNNLNQLAHAVNSERFVGRASESTYLSVLDALLSVELLLKAHLASVD